MRKINIGLSESGTAQAHKGIEIFLKKPGHGHFLQSIKGHGYLRVFHGVRANPELLRVHYIDMESYECNLSHYIDRCYREEGGIPKRVIWGIVQQIASALKYLQRENVYDLVLKPETGKAL